MEDILSQAHRGMLAAFARTKGLVAFDYDGTLAPIVDDPGMAEMRPETRFLLNQVCERYPCMVISGRRRHDVREKLRGTGVRYVVGNHGAELGNTRELKRIVAEWKQTLAPAVSGLDGVWVEDKEYSLAVHYRHSPEKAEARRKIVRAARMLPGARLVPAKQALNVIPEGAPHKGLALQARRHELACDTALFVGDDATDEDVFSIGDGVLGIRVGRSRGSKAGFWIRQQRDVDELLRTLAELREQEHGDLAGAWMEGVTQH